MISTRTFVIALAVLSLSACHSKKKQEEQEFIPPGYYLTRAEAQNFANKANADLAKTRAENKTAGVQSNALSCGEYKVVSTQNSDGKVFWGARMDTTGCSNKPVLPRFSTPQTGGKKP